MKKVKLIDLIPDIQGNKNVTQKHILRVIRALPKVISKMLLDKEEVKFSPFFKLGFRVAKDRMVKSTVTKEVLHMPKHIRFKATFYEEFKEFINKEQ